jgi:hypothetical protein
MSRIVIFGFRCEATSKLLGFVASYGGPEACMYKLLYVNFVKS